MNAERKRALLNILLYAVFGVYIVLLALILFRQHHAARSVNLIPLRSIISYLTGVDLVSDSGIDPAFLRGLGLSNILGNIVIFVPLGVYITLFSRDKRVWKNALLAAAASLAVETVQVIFRMGIGDIDDVILNGIGGLLGVLLCRGIFRLCKGDGFKTRCTVAVLAPLAGILSFAVLILLN